MNSINPESKEYWLEYGWCRGLPPSQTKGLLAEAGFDVSEIEIKQYYEQENYNMHEMFTRMEMNEKEQLPMTKASILKFRLEELPQLALDLCNEGAYITGSTALYLLGECDKRSDLDIIVPVRYWSAAYKLFKTASKGAPVTPDNNTSLGGWGFKVKEDAKDEWNIDIWPDDIFDYLTRAKKGKNRIVVLDIIGERMFEKSAVDVPSLSRSDDDIPF